ncbi:FliM/FliN family flagellar motor switch protein [[Brevibacterium] frigoritolerans]|nr:FliM/FliN family flagellar motor switch protein [Peribacillus frigoritolerans]
MSDEFENQNQNVSNNDGESTPVTNPVILEELTADSKPGLSLENLHKLGDVELPVRVVFANIEKNFEEVINFTEGDVVALNRFAGEPVDILVGDRVFAKGEITVVDDCFGVRIVDILPSGERLSQSIEE